MLLTSGAMHPESVRRTNGIEAADKATVRINLLLSISVSFPPPELCFFDFVHVHSEHAQLSNNLYKLMPVPGLVSVSPLFFCHSGLLFLCHQNQLFLVLLSA